MHRTKRQNAPDQALGRHRRATGPRPLTAMGNNALLARITRAFQDQHARLVGRAVCAISVGMVCAALPISGAMAQSETGPDTLPSFAVCLNNDVHRFEQALRAAQRDDAAGGFTIGDVRGVEYCGSVGIVTCDRSETPLPCQHALAREQRALTRDVLGSLPLPVTRADTRTDPDTGAETGTDTDAGAGPGTGSDTGSDRAAEWPQTLYPVLHALAHGASAGPDCAGNTETLAAWCDAREANRSLATAILTWQLARFLNTAPDAISAGWAGTPPPVRPRLRPERNKG